MSRNLRPKIHLGAITLALLLFASLLPADAQSARTLPRVAYLGGLSESEPSPFRDAFVQSLRELGHIPGQTVMLDVRRWTTEGQLRQVLSDVVQLKVDIVVVRPPFAAMVAKEATKAIPIVCGSCGDPVENGLAASLARPGGNVTGLASLSAELIGKRMQLLKELLPSVSRVAVFVFPANPGTRPTLRALDAAGRTLGIEIQRVEIRGLADFDNAFRSAVTGGAKAVVLQDDPLVRAARGQIAELASKHRMPVSTGISEVAEAGALIAYSPDRVDMLRRAAGFVDKILKGAKPADLPFEQATKLDLVLNLKTAKALGVTIPQTFLLRASRVIE